MMSLVAESKIYAIKSELRGQAQLLLWLAPFAVIAMLVIALVGPPGPGDRGAFEALLAVFAASIPFALWFRSVSSATIEVNDDAVIYRRGRKVTTIRWPDVQKLENHRVSKRLKVFSAKGAVINVEYQFAGFQELAEIIAKRSGRSIDHMSQAAQELLQGDVEITPPVWYRYFYFVFIPVAAYFFCLTFVLQAWRRHNAGLLLAALIGGWLVVRAARGLWFRVAMRLRMDASGIHFTTRKETVSALWADISTAQLEHTDGDTWFIVRDRNGEPVLALQREFFNWTGGAMKQFDRLAATAQRRTTGS